MIVILFEIKSWRRLFKEVIQTVHERSNYQLADLFMEPLGGSKVKYICNKLGVYDICGPA